MTKGRPLGAPFPLPCRFTEYDPCDGSNRSLELANRDTALSRA